MSLQVVVSFTREIIDTSSTGITVKPTSTVESHQGVEHCSNTVFFSDLSGK